MDMDISDRLHITNLTEEKDDSDTESEIIVIEENRAARTNRLKKRFKKKMSEEEDHKQLLIESGFDFEDMTEEERSAIVNVLIQSKRDALDEQDKTKRHTGIIEPDHDHTRNKHSSKIQSRDDGQEFTQCQSQDTGLNIDVSNKRIPSISHQSRKDRSKSEHTSSSVKSVESVDVFDIENDHEEACEVIKEKENTISSNRSNQSGEKLKRRTRQADKKKAQDSNKNLKQRKIDQFSHVVIHDDDSMEEEVTTNCEQNKEASVVQNQEMKDAHKSLMADKVHEKFPCDDDDDDLTQPPDSPEMFVFEQLLDPSAKESKRENIKEKEENDTEEPARAENKIKAEVDSQATQPFDAETQVDENIKQSGDGTPAKNRENFVTKQIDIGKNFFERFKNSASKVTGKWNRKRKADDTGAEEKTEKEEKKKFEDEEALKMSGITNIKTCDQNISPEYEIEENTPESKQSDQINDDYKEFETSEPLKRHYRTKKKKSTYFLCAPDLKSIPTYSKAILQLFEIYQRKLMLAQSQIPETMKWGEPVKAGQHLDKTIDFKRRGHSYDFLESEEGSAGEAINNDTSVANIQASADKNMFQENQDTKQQARTYKRIKNPIIFSDDDDFENLDKRNEEKAVKNYGRTGRNTRSGKKILYTEECPYLPESETKNDPDWTELMEADTQEIKLGNGRKGRRGRVRQIQVSSKRPLTRNISDLSNTSPGSSHLNSPLPSPYSVSNEKDTERPPSRGSESSMEGLSQGSSLMLNEQGELYSTQVCVLKEKWPNLKVKPSRNMINVQFESNMNDQEESPMKGSKQKYNFRNVSKIGGDQGKNLVNKSVLDEEEDCIIQGYQQEASEWKRSGKVSASCTKNSDLKATNALSRDKEDVDLISNSDSEDEISFKTERERKGYSAIKNDSFSVFRSMKKERGSTKSENPTGAKSINSASIKPFQFYITNDKTANSPLLHEMNEHNEKAVQEGISSSTDGHKNRDDCDKDFPNADNKIGAKPDNGDRRGRKRLHEESIINQQKKRKDQVETMACPLCLQLFPRNEIEEHASECDGTVEKKHERQDEEQLSDDDGRDRKLVTKMSSPAGIEQKTDISSESQGAMTSSLSVSDNNMDDANEDNVENVHEKERINCYICDESYPKGQIYQNHVDDCIQRAKLRQEEADLKGYGNQSTSKATTILVEKRTTRSKIKEENSGLLGRLDKVWEDTADGYSSDNKTEQKPLRNILNNYQTTETSESETDYSGSDEYDYSPVKTSPKSKPKSDLPGGWTLDELTNSPIKSFIPIWCQTDSEGFKNQFDNAKRKYEKQILRKKMSGKSVQRKQRKRKRKRRKAGFGNHKNAKKVKLGD